jgi:hypothetical protein
VKRQLFCEDIKPPPDIDVAGAAAMPIDDPDKYSSRFLVQNQTAPAGCQGCHASINSIGFALDYYDPLGRWRTVEQRYGAAGTVVATFPMPEDIGIRVLAGREPKVGGAMTLMEEIVSSELASGCVVSQWLAFSAQRDRHAVKSCLKQRLHPYAASGGTGVVEMIRQSALAELDAVYGRTP